MGSKLLVHKILSQFHFRFVVRDSLYGICSFLLRNLVYGSCSINLVFSYASNVTQYSHIKSLFYCRMNVDHEIKLLVQEMKRLGSPNADGNISVKFGTLFADDKCANLFEGIHIVCYLIYSTIVLFIELYDKPICF